MPQSALPLHGPLSAVAAFSARAATGRAQFVGLVRARRVDVGHMQQNERGSAGLIGPRRSSVPGSLKELLEGGEVTPIIHRPVHRSVRGPTRSIYRIPGGAAPNGRPRPFGTREGPDPIRVGTHEAGKPTWPGPALLVLSPAISHVHDPVLYAPGQTADMLFKTSDVEGT